MALADRLTAPAPLIKGPKCSVAVVLALLPPADAEALTTALAAPDWTGEAIAQALQAEGHRVQAATIQRHRRGRCTCEPNA